jgi:hypothetical protein
MPLTLNGKTHTVPGTYGTISVINLGGSALPLFNVLLFAGSSKKGMPYNASGKKGYEVILPFASLNDVKDYYGSGNISEAFQYGQKGGGGIAFCVNVAPLTKAVAVLQDNAGTPANTLELQPADKFYGAAGNDISLTIASADSKPTLTIIPPKLTKFLTINASTTSPVITLDNIEGLALGATVLLVDNAASAPQSVTITTLDTVNKRITLSANPTSAFATSDYARIFQEDVLKQATITFESTATIIDVLDWINTTGILLADRKAYTGIVPTTLSKKYIQNFTSATKGTSPDATETAGGDFDLFAGAAPQLFEEFRNQNKIRIRIICLLSKDAAVHSVYRTLAQTFRNQQNSVKVIAGVASGDIALAESNANHTIKRSKALNSGDFVLASMGMDNRPAYLSFAPFLAGLISANSPNHNLTNDSVPAIVVEKTFGDFNSETETKKYLASGCILIGTGPNGFFIIQGISTYQNQMSMWNEDDDTTYLIQQRDVVDFVFEGYRQDQNEGVGSDGYGPDAARVRGLKKLKQFNTDGFIEGDYKILEAKRIGNAVITKPSIKPAGLTDFVGFELQVVIPE